MTTPPTTVAATPLPTRTTPPARVSGATIASTDAACGRDDLGVEALPVEIVLQDGSVATYCIADTVHNRQLQNYIARHESYALAHARSAQVAK